MPSFDGRKGVMVFAVIGLPRFDWLRERAYGKILDIGCNRGDTFNGMPNAGDVMGVDLDLWSPAYGLGFKQADAHFLPFKDGEFDVCILAEILEHVYDPVKVLSEARRVASKFVLISVPYEFNWSAERKPCSPLDEQLKERKITYEQLFAYETLSQPGCTGAIDDRTNRHLWHIRWYTADTLCEDIEKAGMKYQIQLLEHDGWSWFMGVLK
jgi:SAM-dependent methyltransferase